MSSPGFSPSSSQETLVEEVEDQPALNVLTFTSSNPSNTTLCKTAGSYMTISTSDRRTSITHSATGELLTLIKYKTFQATTIQFARFYEGRPMKLAEWLKKIKTKNGKKMYTFETYSGKYSWCEDTQQQLLLCRACAESQELILRIQERPASYGSTNTTRLEMIIHMSEGITEIPEIVLASYSIVEQLRGLRSPWRSRDGVYENAFLHAQVIGFCGM